MLATLRDSPNQSQQNILTDLMSHPVIISPSFLRVVDEPVRVQVLVGVKVGVALLAVEERLAGAVDGDPRVQLAHVLRQLRHSLPADLALGLLLGGGGGGGLGLGGRLCNGGVKWMKMTLDILGLPIWFSIKFSGCIEHI